jgi:uncharacterized membrane protein YhaH (DUF805 family)
MSFAGSLLHVFSPRGRSNRVGFWISVVGIVSLLRLVEAAQPNRGSWPHTVAIAVLILVQWISIATSIKRLHDLGRSGWWVSINLVMIGLALSRGMAAERLPSLRGLFLFLHSIETIATLGFVLWLGCAKGHPRSERVRPSPKPWW